MNNEQKNTTKEVIKIILIVLILIAQIFFGINIKDINIDLSEQEKEIREVREEVQKVESSLQK